VALLLADYSILGKHMIDLRSSCFAFILLVIFATSCTSHGGWNFSNTLPSNTDLAWLRERQSKPALGVAFDVSIINGMYLSIKLANKLEATPQSDIDIPYAFLSNHIYFDDMIFREAWHKAFGPGVTLVYLSTEKRVYGYSAEHGYSYGWSPSIIDVDSVIPGSYIRMLHINDELTRRVEIFPLIQAFLKAFPQCRNMQGKFMIMARVPLLQPIEGGFSEVRCVYKVVEVPESIAARAVAAKDSGNVASE
jgi:hypothetical protein